MSVPTNIDKAVTSMASAILRLQARCDALEAVLRVLARKPGLEDQHVQKLIRDLTEAAHQQLLERVESLSPDLAVELDRRAPLDLPEDFL
jgi:hypothetical protein